MPLRERRLSGKHSIPRPPLLSLQGEADPLLTTHLLDSVGLVPDNHDDRIGVQALGCMDDMRQQWLAGQLMQHLGLSRTHTLAHTGSKNNNP